MSEPDINDNPQPLFDPYSDIRDTIEDRHDRGEIDDELYERLLGQAIELEQRHQQEREAVESREYADDFDCFLDCVDLQRKHASQRRSFEFKAVDMDLRGVAAQYDHIIKNLFYPDQDENARLWQSLSPQQKQGFRERVLAQGEYTAEELDHMIRAFWE